MAEFYSHIAGVTESLNSQNGQMLAQQLSMTELLITTLNNQPNNPTPRKPATHQMLTNNLNQYNLLKKIDLFVKKANDLDTLVLSKIKTGDRNQNQLYSEVVSNRLKSISAIFESRYSDAFKYLCEEINSFVKIFELWSSPLLWKLCLDIRLMAELASLNSANEINNNTTGKKTDYFEEATRILLSKCFQAANADRTNIMSESKKNAAMGVVNQLFHIYFKINNLKLCKNLITTIESSGFPPLENYPLSQLITYRFFNGRLSVFNGNYKKAQQDLLFAFSKCPSTSFKNKRLILLYLVPMQLEQCKFPKKSLLEKYKLHQFVDIVQSIKSGNIKLFNQCLTAHQNFFISKGIYLILEKLKIIVYRNLFKKVFLMNTGGNKIPIGNFVAALKWMENDSVDIDETECILANLISNGYLKGYISHKVGLVVSPTNPFPKLPLP